jgi:hypothetical protein
MKIATTPALIVGFAAAFALSAGATYALSPVSRSGQPERTTAANAASAARTSFPGLIAATAEPSLTGLNGVRPGRPRPGTVARVTGPFDDRFTLNRLVFERSGVTGTVTVTSDVSDILELEAVAGFYDRSGKLLGTNRFVHHLVEDSHPHSGPPSELQKFTIAVPTGLRDRAVSAAVGIPVLVNE